VLFYHGKYEVMYGQYRDVSPEGGMIMAVYHGAYSGPEIDRLLAKADMSDVFSEERLNGMSFEQISRADYDSLAEKDADRVYFVYDEKGRVRQYIGEAQLGGASVTAGSIIPSLRNHMQMTAGKITEE